LILSGVGRLEKVAEFFVALLHYADEPVLNTVWVVGLLALLVKTP
jgi:hypothetical protein